MVAAQGVQANTFTNRRGGQIIALAATSDAALTSPAVFLYPEDPDTYPLACEAFGIQRVKLQT